MASQHAYALSAEWTGNAGSGTSGYRDYGRNVVLRIGGKPDLLASADRPFRGDADRWNPEELLLAALSECHLLSYLHVAVKHGVVVTGYTVEATGSMVVTDDDAGHFTRVDLHPRVVLADESQRELADSLHAEANRLCFIANSVNFPVHHAPVQP
ncbi:OsmC family protein [Amnibacterium kyonggiense]|uniref:Organic hydroperoxide reductase OsmC/OhrA n=1 Tax=Amnibacterium kyonggiense TaxID=595671 RepID=A0A4R7FGJ4_9MICO|nr:OsmC family protein [Amnibacterium kyonggiense]TDS75747.1 organic hydroperoxide reductase OsmC/OhrA [Amnibacterium kyonggiense]